MINVQRSYPAPKITKSFRNRELLEALGNIFYNKCYLCEMRYETPNSFEVEHFISRREDSTKERDWDNLYLACRNCNGFKPDRTPVGGYLDPCDPKDDVENSIHYEYNLVEAQPMFIPTNGTAKETNICDLLDILHNVVESNNDRVKLADLRTAIQKQGINLLTCIAKQGNSQDQIDKMRAKITIGRISSRKSPFTMLMRSIIKEYGTDELQQLFD